MSIQRYNNCRTCEIHSDNSFAIDEECDICDQDSNYEYMAVYQNHIECLNREIKKLKNKLEISEQNYNILMSEIIL